MWKFKTFQLLKKEQKKLLHFSGTPSLNVKELPYQEHNLREQKLSWKLQHPWRTLSPKPRCVSLLTRAAEVT